MNRRLASIRLLRLPRPLRRRSAPGPATSTRVAPLWARPLAMLFREERRRSRTAGATVRVLAPSDGRTIVLAPRLALNLSFARLLGERAAARPPAAGPPATARLAPAERRLPGARRPGAMRLVAGRQIVREQWPAAPGTGPAAAGRPAPRGAPDRGTRAPAPRVRFGTAPPSGAVAAERSAGPVAGLSHRAPEPHLEPPGGSSGQVRPGAPSRPPTRLQTGAGIAVPPRRPAPAAPEPRRGQPADLQTRAGPVPAPAAPEPRRGQPADLQTRAGPVLAPAAPDPRRGQPADLQTRAGPALVPAVPDLRRRKPADRQAGAAPARAAPAAGRLADHRARPMVPAGRAARFRLPAHWTGAADFRTGKRDAARAPAAHPHAAAVRRNARLGARAPAARLAPSGPRAPRRGEGWPAAPLAAAPPMPGAGRSASSGPSPIAGPSLDFAPSAAAAAATSAATRPPAREAALDYRRPPVSDRGEAAIPAAPAAKPPPPPPIDLDSLSRELWKRFDSRIRLEAERYGRV